MHSGETPEETGGKKPIVVKKRTLAAVLLSGHDDISPEEREQLFEKDKKFRLENPKYNKY